MIRQSARAAGVAAFVLVLAVAACSKPKPPPPPAGPREPTAEELLAAKEAKYRDFLRDGQKALDAKKPDEALVHLEQAVTVKPTGFEAQLRLARLYVDKKQDDKAVRAYQAATAADPSLADGYLECAALLERLGRLEDARSAYSGLIHQEISPALTAKAYWQRAELSDRLNKRGDYRYDREQAIKTDPGYAVRVTAGDVVVTNHTEKDCYLTVNKLVAPDGTERALPNVRFPVRGDNTAYLVHDGKYLAAKSITFTVWADDKSRTFNASYEKGASLEIHLHGEHIPRSR
ncbi:MAG: tetratricopeptide repeat protein [Gemmataceae bacterium]|nr:tetratricopeptide repeat protein [Gemmataceae bacterium]